MTGNPDRFYSLLPLKHKIIGITNPPLGDEPVCKSGTIDLRYKGATKKEGTLYAVLAQDLKDKALEPHEAFVVADRPETDIGPAQERGFRTIQYRGFVNLGASKADIVVRSSREFIGVLRKSRP